MASVRKFLSQYLRRSRWMILFILTLTMVFEFVSPARADGPLIPGYTPQDGQHIPAPTGYVQMSVITGEGQPSGPFAAPQDLFLDPSTGNLLVADTGNNRIVILDNTGKYLYEIGGQSAGLKGPEGVFVDVKGDIWVADKGNQRVAVFAPDGTLISQHFKPESDFLIDMDFSPSKLVVDRRGFIYVVSGSESNLGVLVVDNTERFRGFFGRTKIGFNLTRLVARFLATKEQRARMLRVKPAPLSNVYIDAQGFIYAVSPILQKDQIQRLNSVGTNVYGEVGTRTGAGKLWEKLRGEEGITFGEETVSWRWDGRMSMSVPQTMGANFTDLAVDDLGIVSALEKRTNQIYQYDQAGNLLTIFGGQGMSAGLFAQPVSIVAGNEGKLYILDAGRGDIQVFRPTELTRMIHQASHEYFDGDYEAAAKLWGEISQKNTNFALSHSGLGKALMGQKRYREAMQEYFYAENKFGYSAAFGEYRHQWMRQNFGFLGLAALAVVAVTGFSANPALQAIRRWLVRLRSLRDQAGLWPVPILLFTTILVRMVSLSAQSFHLSQMRPDQIRILIEGGKILIPWVTWCVAALGVGEIFYGEGTFRKIVVASAWALWPLILLPIPLSLLTHVITRDEKTVYDILWWLTWGLLAWQFIKVVRDVHQFELGQAILVTLQNLLGILVVWILVGLVYALTAEIFRFIGQIIMEIYVRLY